MPPAHPSPTVLLLTHSGDFFVIDRVIEALQRRGARAVRFDTDRFPRELGIGVLDAGDGPRYLLDTGEGELDTAEVDAVWTRSLWPPDFGDELDPEHRGACQAQTKEALDGFLFGLAHARWINELHAMRRASNKIHQLRAARRAGLTVPRTLVTNEPERVRRFYEQVDGRVVTKLLAELTFETEERAGVDPGRQR